MEEKITYGSSIMDVNNNESKDETSDNFKIEYTEEETEACRKELIESSESKRVEAQISFDAISGTRISNAINEFNDNINKEGSKTKTINDKVIRIVKEMTGVELSKDDCDRIEKFFTDNDEMIETAQSNPFYDKFDINLIRDALGVEITNVIDSISKDNEDNEVITRRLISQIYTSYSLTSGGIDDMRELSKLMKDIEKHTISKRQIESDSNSSKEDLLDNQVDMYNTLNTYIETRKRLDERNKRLRADYSIDDADTRMLSEVKDALQDALTQKTLTKYLNNNIDRLRIEVKNSDERMHSIMHWVINIKNDPETIYTLPCNDHLTIKETIIEVCNFIRDALICEEFKDYPIPENYTDSICKYYIENNVCTQTTIDSFSIEAELLLYIISRTFKARKIIDIYNRRVLSYTLDMIGKLSNPTYRQIIYGFAEYVYNTLSK